VEPIAVPIAVPVTNKYTDGRGRCQGKIEAKWWRAGVYYCKISIPWFFS